MTTYQRQRGNIGFVALLLFAGVLIFVAWWVRSVNSPLGTDRQSEEVTEQERIEAGIKYRVEITDKGFVPGVLTVEPYDTVTFVNRDVYPHFPVSGDLDGEHACAEFGSGRQLLQNEAYAVIFKEENECAFYDSLNEDFSAGTIFIAEQD